MKKTEKIELRVNHEEKERLAGIAKHRGQTVSDVVRDALGNDLGRTSVSYQKLPVFISLLALGLATISLFWVSRGAPQRPVMSTTSLYLPDSSGGSVLNTQVPHRDKFSQTYSVISKTRHLQLTHEVSEIKANVFQLAASVCEEQGEGCSLLGEATVVLASPSEPPRMGQVAVRDGSGIEYEDIQFYIEVLGPSLQKIEDQVN